LFYIIAQDIRGFFCNFYLPFKAIFFLKVFLFLLLLFSFLYFKHSNSISYRVFCIVYSRFKLIYESSNLLIWLVYEFSKFSLVCIAIYIFFIEVTHLRI